MVLYAALEVANRKGLATMGRGVQHRREQNGTSLPFDSYRYYRNASNAESCTYYLPASIAAYAVVVHRQKLREKGLNS